MPLLLGDASKAKKVLDWESTIDLDQLAEMMYESDLSLIKSK